MIKINIENSSNFVIGIINIDLFENNSNKNIIYQDSKKSINSFILNVIKGIITSNNKLTKLETKGWLKKNLYCIIDQNALIENRGIWGILVKLYNKDEFY